MIAACGEGDLGGSQPDAPPSDTIDAGVPDAELPDARPVGSLERIDWRTVRGEPLPATTVSLPAAELFGLADDGFVLRTECDDPLGCTFTWHDGAGAETNRREHLIGTTATTVSPDGRRALLLAADEVGTCDDSNQRFVVERGTLQLLDLATGEATLDLFLRSNPWSAPAFTPDNRWFFAAPIPDGKCLPTRLGYRSAAAPFAEAPGLAPSADFVQAVDAHRWLAFRGFDLGVVDPDVAESFIPLAEDPSRFDAAGGWVHAYVGFGDLAHEIVSLSPTNQVRRTSVERDEDWFPAQAFGRWVRVCGFLRMPGFRDCRIIDVLGEKSPVNVRVIHAPDHPDDAILMDEGAFVFVGPSGADGRAVKRLDLATGQLDTLHEGDGKLSPLGDGEAALLLQGEDVWLIEPRREELLAHRVRFLLTAPRVDWLNKLRQHDIALLAPSADGATLSLLVVDLRTRRLAQLTDHLYLTPQLAVDDCGQPATTRHTAGSFDGLIQDGGHLFFVEKPPNDDGSAALWILPVDLSAAPRRLATLSDATRCHAPLTSPSGERVGFFEDDPDTGEVRITVAAP